jgi:imidazolonepropionase-like amidohydrolase
MGPNGPVLLALLLAGCGSSGAATMDVHEVCTGTDDGAWGDTRVRAHSLQEPAAQTQAVALLGGTVFTAAGEIIDDGAVIFDRGRVQWVGTAEDAPVTDEMVRIDTTGRFITPGIIDTHSHLGVYAAPEYSAHSDGNEATAPITAQVEAVDSVWPQDPGFEAAMAGGVTTMMILPGSANLIGGQGFVMRNRSGALHAEELRFAEAPGMLKMACGENPKRVYGASQMPSTRMGEIAVVRQALLEARRALDGMRRYEEQLATWCDADERSGEPPQRPEMSLQTQTLAGLMTGDILAQIHCYRADEMLAQIALADEFGYQIRSFHHAVEAYKIADELAAADISVSTWADWWGFKLEAYDAVMQNAALVHVAGGRAVIHSDSPIGIQRLNQEAAKAYYAGLQSGLELTEDDAIRWITDNAAWTLGVDHLTGRLEDGLMADVVVWSGHPLSIYAQPDLVYLDGVLQFDRAVEQEPWSDFEAGQWPLSPEAP